MGQRPKILFALFALMVSLASFATINRNVVWKEQVLTWHDALNRAPSKSRAYLNRGVGYAFLNKLDLAFKDYNRAIELDNKNFGAYHNRGVIFNERGDYESA
ncbi:tetratricopeptide repeat protein, partial [Thermodesulfobacteriota bacterium]